MWDRMMMIREDDASSSFSLIISSPTHFLVLIPLKKCLWLSFSPPLLHLTNRSARCCRGRRSKRRLDWLGSLIKSWGPRRGDSLNVFKEREKGREENKSCNQFSSVIPRWRQRLPLIRNISVQLFLPSLVLCATTSQWLTTRLCHEGCCSTDETPTKNASRDWSQDWIHEWKYQEDTDGSGNDLRDRHSCPSSFQDHCQWSLKGRREEELRSWWSLLLLFSLLRWKKLTVVLNDCKRMTVSFCQKLSPSTQWSVTCISQSLLFFSHFLSYSIVKITLREVLTYG